MKCSHCQLEFKESELFKEVINHKELHFCCTGCARVYALLLDLNLESFYDKLNDSTLAPVTPQDSMSALELEQALEENNKGDFILNLLLEKTHCNACLWLNQKVLERLSGVKKVSVNFTTHHLQIVFEKSLNPKEIIQKIESLGYGAKIYNAQNYTLKAQKEQRSYLLTLSVGFFATMNLMFIAIAKYASYGGASYGGANYGAGMDKLMQRNLDLVSLFLSLLVLVVVGRFFIKGAFYGLKNGVLGMDLSVSFGALSAFVYSVYAMLVSQETYFEASSTILTLVFGSKFLELKARLFANEKCLALESHEIHSVIVVENGKQTEKHPKDVAIGSVVWVPSGAKIALDGVLLNNASVDASLISGEFKPLELGVNDPILGGYVNVGVPFSYQVSANFQNSRLSGLLETLKKSFLEKPLIESSANQIADIFSKAVLFLAFVSFLLWQFGLGGNFEKALMVCISVLVISCPCAFALATPIALVIGVFKNPLIVFKEALFLETLAKVKKIFIDKTGTLTQKEVLLKEKIIYEEFDGRLLKSLLKVREHLAHSAILKSLDGDEVSLEKIEFFAHGLKASYQNETLLVGSLKFLGSMGVDIPMKESANIMVGFAKNETLCALFILEERLKANAKEVVQALQNKGLELEILSGDNESSVKECAKKLGISNYHAHLTPEDKAQTISSYKGVCAMVGDGNNDALALKQASVSLGFEKSALSKSACDILLLEEDLSLLKKAFDNAQKVYQVVLQNIVLSLIYNAILIPVAMLGYINPLIASLSMSASSLLVVLNSLRLKRS
ncbi:heavy metal translocating P-type ATPase [Helicobacter pylori]|jgi:ATPase, P-type (transporting), HAD superfamily, subfamily IC/heavy metal translocating P-type ATPase|uniref:Copper-transporting ATPase n=3 Tax=Helicobacter pylori TaxID=210 RepID=O26033_HELPY|nr:heavy metal translocating P-type ATPase [Helicobacter pylori]AAD08539.1 cation-transporting ATPase, P-type (copA) [Helicobacter pylori 26695]AFV42726.1 cation-transporting ATPase, P-type (copA) [Helicobacter pylori 26695]AFV44323.1 cation-transporting ATPase, P-type (copA) [Helicobacter pylori Rif1]AFV45913.1 cation-transporting ATPase, P-type (copA) [Helicobacter pylori Rif2]AJF09707.1 carbonate dehydratase [Helicobacter pylori 26695-1]